MSESALSSWESFYVIVGSSAGALTGLQFVVMALVADTRRSANPDQISAFGTPNIVHFCVVLLQSAILSAPWPAVGDAALLLGVIGAIVLLSNTTVALFMLGTMALLLLFSGIHNAWDTVTFLVTNPVNTDKN